MMTFIVYETATGIIKRTGVCQEHMLDAQAHEGESAMEGYLADDPSEYIVDDSQGAPMVRRIEE
jgi:hypothetical protein